MQTIDEGERKARKNHTCFNCYRDINVGSYYRFGTYKNDFVYTIKSHADCQKAAWWFIDQVGYDDYGDGFPPLFDMLSEDGELINNLNYMRGFFPHVVCRIEYKE